MNSNQRDAPRPPRRTLTDLPPELKAIIARMARDQDAAYKERRPGGFGLLGNVEWDGKSAKALAVVDRGWHSAVAPLLFETITSNGCRKSIFGLRIAPRFGRAVKRVSFEGIHSDPTSDEEDDWLALLRALPFFVNLGHLGLAEEAAESLFRSGGEDQATLRQSLQSMAPSILSLDIATSKPDSLVYILPGFTNLRRLSLCSADDEAWSLNRAAIESLGQCSTLQDFQLECIGEELLVKINQAGIIWPALRTLKLDFDEPVGEATWTFIRSFNPSLGTLTIASNGGLSREVVAERDSPSPTFPKLLRLTLEARIRDISLIPTLHLFSTSPVRHLILAPYGNGLAAAADPGSHSPSATAPLEAVLRLFPSSLRSVYFRYNFLRNTQPLRSLAPSLHSLASARNIGFTISPFYDVFIHREMLKRRGAHPLDDVDDHCDNFDEVLRFGLAQTGGLRASRDRVAVDALREALLPLKASMLRARD